MPNGLILLTGATGHVGYRTLVEALSQGYQVRAAIRSEAKSTAIKNATSTQPYLDQLSFVVVPNIEADGAFDEAVKGVDYIVHIASPLTVQTTDYERDIIQPAIRGTLSILHSALKEPNIKCVVITSSVAAIASSTPGKPYTADNVEPDPTGPYPNQFAAYSASKRLAYNRTRAFITEQHPQFTVNHVMPSFVIGKNELATTPETVNSGSNSLALIAVLGGKNPNPTPMFVTHVSDVAYTHIAALDPKFSHTNHNFGVNYDGLNADRTWDSAKEIVKRHFPEHVASNGGSSSSSSSLLPVNGEHASVHTPFDASGTERELGIRFKSWEDMVVDLVGWYVEVSGKN